MSHFLEQVRQTREYRLIAEFCGDSKAAHPPSWATHVYKPLTF